MKIMRTIIEQRHTLNALTDNGNVAENSKICLFEGNLSINESRTLLKSIESSLSA